MSVHVYLPANPVVAAKPAMKNNNNKLMRRTKRRPIDRDILKIQQNRKNPKNKFEYPNATSNYVGTRVCTRRRCACNGWQRRHFEVKELGVYIVNTVLDCWCCRRVSLNCVNVVYCWRKTIFESTFDWLTLNGEASSCETQTAWTATK